VYNISYDYVTNDDDYILQCIIISTFIQYKWKCIYMYDEYITARVHCTVGQWFKLTFSYKFLRMTKIC